jgi:hypothetical protein
MAIRNSGSEKRFPFEEAAEGTWGINRLMPLEGIAALLYRPEKKKVPKKLKRSPARGGGTYRRPLGQPSECVLMAIGAN